MSDYTTVDRERLKERLSNIAAVLRDTEIPESAANEIDSELSEINNLLHDIDKPIFVEDRTPNGGFEIVVGHD